MSNSNLFETKIITVILLFLLISLCYPEGELEKSADFLNIGTSAKASALGGAFVAVCNDATAFYYNPAGLVNLNRSSIASMFTDLFIDQQYNFINYVHLFKFATIGLSWISFKSSGIELWDPENQFLGKISDNENAYIISYAQKINNKLSFGVNFKHITQDVCDASAKGNSFDIGLFYKPKDKLNLGLTIHDINGKLKWDTETNEENNLPLLIRIGASYKLNNNLLAALDIEDKEETSPIIHTGFEYLLSPQIALRAGIDNKEPTFGIGVISNNFRIDYAYKDTELGETNKISIVYEVGTSLPIIAQEVSPVKVQTEPPSPVAHDFSPAKEKQKSVDTSEIKKLIKEIEEIKIVGKEVYTKKEKVDTSQLSPVIQEFSTVKEKEQPQVIIKPPLIEELKEEKLPLLSEPEVTIKPKPTKELKEEKPQFTPAREKPKREITKKKPEIKKSIVKKQEVKPKNKIRLIVGKAEFILNNKRYGLIIPPLIKKGKIFVPLSWDLFEPFGFKHSVNVKDNLIYISIQKATKKLTFIFDISREGKVEVLLNNKKIELIPAPYLRNGYLMLPIHGIYKLLNLNIIFE